MTLKEQLKDREVHYFVLGFKYFQSGYVIKNLLKIVNYLRWRKHNHRQSSKYLADMCNEDKQIYFLIPVFYGGFYFS